MTTRFRSFSTSALMVVCLWTSFPAQATPRCDATDAVDIWLADPLPTTEKIGDGAVPSTPSLQSVANTPLRFVFLLDNSRSMYPGYPEAKRGRDFYIDMDAFRSFIVDDVGASFRNGTDSAVLMTFETSGHVWRGRRGKSTPAAGSFDKAAIGSRQELHDGVMHVKMDQTQAGNKSRMLHGLTAAKTVLGEQSGSGVIWLVTDNIYDGIGKGSETVATEETDENRLFYEAIRDDQSLRVVVAYPVVQGTSGAWLENTSLFVYGIYFDGDTSRETPPETVRWMLGDGVPGVLASDAHTTAMKKYSAPTNPSPGKPFRLKPLDQDVVRISLKQEIAQVDEYQQMGDPVNLRATLTIENLLKHRIIDSVRFRVDNDVWAGWEPASKGTSGTLMDTIVPACANTFDSSVAILNQPIGPGESREIDVEMTMPPVDYEIHSFGDAMEVGTNEFVVMGGALHADLIEMKSHMSISPEAFEGTYGAQSLPDVFRNPDVRSYQSTFVGRTEPIENPGTVMALAMLGLGGLGAGLFALGGWMMRSVGRRLRVDGSDQGAVSVSRLRATPILSRGRSIARARLTIAGKVKVTGTNGYVAKKGSSGWTLHKSGAAPVSVELRQRR